MSKKKTKSGLPPRWRFKNGAYFYVPAKEERHRWDDKKWFRLGATLAEANRTFARRADLSFNVDRMGELCERYALEVVPLKAAATQKSNDYSMQRIRQVFEDSEVQEIDPQHIYQYRDWCARNWSKKTANLDLEVLSHMFTKAIEWGARKDHPMTNKKVTKFSLPPRTRYVTDQELAEFRENFAGPFLDAYLELKGLTGLRKGDLLSIKQSDFIEGHLRVVPRKTKGTQARPMLFEMTPEMYAAVAKIKALPGRVKSSVWLFSTRTGQPYIDLEPGENEGNTSGFDSIWQRRMVKFGKAGNERFTEHDLRAKVGSDEESVTGAQKILGHSTAQQTDRVYRRKGEVISPAKGFGGKKKKGSIR